MHLVVGLGNPGPQYRNHRHNVGFMAVDALHARTSASEWREKYVGLAARGVIAGQQVVLLKPQTFMNLSGRAVQKAMAQLGLKLQDIIVVHDELELGFDDVRAKKGGGLGGHNGLRDINAALGPDFARVRVGIGRPSQGTVEGYVLSPFNADETSRLDAVLTRAADVVELVIGRGIDAAVTETTPRASKPKGK